MTEIRHEKKTMWTYTGQNYEINDFPSLRNILKGKRTTNYNITIYQIRKVNTGYVNKNWPI